MDTTTTSGTSIESVEIVKPLLMHTPTHVSTNSLDQWSEESYPSVMTLKWSDKYCYETRNAEFFDELVAKFPNVVNLIFYHVGMDHLVGIELFTKLRKFVICNCEIESTRGIGKCDGLRELYIKYSIINDYDELEKLKLLQKFGCYDSTFPDIGKFQYLKCIDWTTSNFFCDRNSDIDFLCNSILLNPDSPDFEDEYKKVINYANPIRQLINDLNDALKSNKYANPFLSCQQSIKNTMDESIGITLNEFLSKLTSVIDDVGNKNPNIKNQINIMCHRKLLSIYEYRDGGDRIICDAVDVLDEYKFLDSVHFIDLLKFFMAVSNRIWNLDELVISDVVGKIVELVAGHMKSVRAKLCPGFCGKKYQTVTNIIEGCIDILAVHFDDLRPNSKIEEMRQLEIAENYRIGRAKVDAEISRILAIRGLNKRRDMIRNELFFLIRNLEHLENTESIEWLSRNVPGIISNVDSEGVSALQMVCCNPINNKSIMFDVVKILIDAKCDLNKVSNEGNTALMTAARHGQIEIMKLLIDSGTDLLIRNQNGANALERAVHYMSSTSSMEAVDILLQAMRKNIK